MRGDLEPSKHPAMDVEYASLNMPRMNSYTWELVKQARFHLCSATRNVIYIRLESDRIEQIMDFRTRVWQVGVASTVNVPIQQAAIRYKITLLVFNARRRTKTSAVE
jgi:hypothetical protein